MFDSAKLGHKIDKVTNTNDAEVLKLREDLLNAPANWISDKKVITKQHSRVYTLSFGCLPKAACFHRRSNGA